MKFMPDNYWKIMGIPIRIHYTLWFAFILIAWSLASEYMPQQYPGLSSITYWIIGIFSAIILFASVLIHEVLHSYVAKKNGLPIARITLFFFGGVSEITHEPRNASLEVRMAAAGPLMSFVLSGVLGFLWFIGTIVNAPVALIAIFNYSAFINLALGIFNLLPAFPLDGGRVLRGSIWKKTKSLLRATKIATRISETISLIMTITGFGLILFGNIADGIWLIFLAWFIRAGAEANLRRTIMNDYVKRSKRKKYLKE
jgi:Zn-dependent protease